MESLQYAHIHICMFKHIFQFVEDGAVIDLIQFSFGFCQREPIYSILQYICDAKLRFFVLNPL